MIHDDVTNGYITNRIEQFCFFFSFFFFIKCSIELSEYWIYYLSFDHIQSSRSILLEQMKKKVQQRIAKTNEAHKTIQINISKNFSVIKISRMHRIPISMFYSQQSIFQMVSARKKLHFHNNIYRLHKIQYKIMKTYSRIQWKK